MFSCQHLYLSFSQQDGQTFENRSMDNVLMAIKNSNRGFSLAGEKIYDHKSLFYVICLT